MIFKKIDHLTIYALVLTLASLLMVYLSLVGRNDSLENERIIMSKKVEAKELGYILSASSDYLTAEVRKFTVTLNPIHLHNYWEEVNVTKRREYVIERLKTLDTPQEEFALLDEAKLQSDELIFTESLAMRLMLEVYGVGEDQMEPDLRDFQLSREYKVLNKVEKVNKARQILYNREYELDKEKIMLPIREFQRVMENRIQKEIEDAQEETDSYYLASAVWQVFLTLFLFVLVFNVIHRIGTPLKDLEHQLNSDPEKVKMSNEAMTIILNITNRINDILTKRS